MDRQADNISAPGPCARQEHAQAWVAAGIADWPRQRDRLAHCWREARVAGAPLSVLHLHLGRLQEVGRVFGDEIDCEVLRQAIVRLGPLLPVTGSLARIGEHTLSLILPGSAAGDAKPFAEALCSRTRTSAPRPAALP